MIIEHIRRFFASKEKQGVSDNVIVKGPHRRLKKPELKNSIFKINAKDVHIKRNPITERCIGFFASSVASIELKLNTSQSYFSRNEDTKMYEDILKQPNWLQDQMSFIECIVFSLLTTRYAYIVAGFDKTISLRCVKSSEVTPVIINEELLGFRINGEHYTKEAVVVICDTGCFLDGRGVSRCDSVKELSFIIDEIMDHNITMLSKTAKANGFIQFNSLISKQQQVEMKEKLEAALYSEHESIPMFAGINWSERAFIRELDYLQTWKMLMEQIIFSFGIPRQLVGMSDGHAAHHYPDIRNHWFADNVLPMAKKICMGLERLLNSFCIDGQVKLRLDVSNVPSLANLQTERVGNGEIK